MKNKRNALPYDVEFKVEDSALQISMKTERLIISLMKAEDENDLTEILSDAVVMATYDTGRPYEEETINEYLEICANSSKNQDPFHAYILREKTSKEFIGFIVVWPSAPGVAEVAYAINPQFQRKGYVSEALNAVLHSLIPRLELRGFKLAHKPLKKLTAIVLPDNYASEKILRRFNFKKENPIFKNDTWYNTFGLFAKPLTNAYQNLSHRRNLEEYEKEYNQMIDQGADISAKDMANSNFGQGSFTARNSN